MSKSLEISLWYGVDTSAFEVECYLWATPDGSLPTLPRSPTVSPSLINDLMNSSTTLQDINLDQESSILATTTIYRLRIGNENTTDGPDLMEHKFDYHRSRSCSGSLLCTVLSGNVCGDYGILISKNEDDSNQMDICRSGFKHNISLDQGDELQLDLWDNGRGSYDVNCFLWCTEDGELPSAAATGQTGVGVDLEESLVGQLKSQAKYYFNFISLAVEWHNSHN